MRKSNIALALAPLAVGFLLTAARAEPGQGEHPCRADVQKLCPGVQQGGGRQRDCLQKHLGEVSPACKERMQRKQAGLDRLRKACEPDVKKFCGDQAAGRAAVACLRKHRDAVSADCQDQLELARYRSQQQGLPHGRKTPPAATASPPPSQP